MKKFSTLALFALIFLITEVRSTGWLGQLLEGLPIGMGKFFCKNPDKTVPAYQLWDSFRNGFSEDKWFYFGAGSFVGDDGVATTSLLQGLKVVSKGKNPKTGLPAFTKTLAQEDDQNGEIVPSGLDHVKWLAFMNHDSTKGYPGFDAMEKYELSFQATISGRSYGVEDHPFGNAVKDASSDLRLGAPCFNVIDFETYMVFDFFITNSKIYAFYERLPFGRGDVLGNYAAFSFQIPVADRNVNDYHLLKVSYDKSKGLVRWFINGREVFRVDKIGYLIDRKYMTLDHGGVETLVSPDQLDAGMGLFTILDGSNPNGKGLVKLSSNEGDYLNPANGKPGHLFIDEQSKEENRLWGQGAELRLRSYEIFNIRTSFF